MADCMVYERSEKPCSCFVEGLVGGGLTGYGGGLDEPQGLSSAIHGDWGRGGFQSLITSNFQLVGFHSCVNLTARRS